MKLKRIKGYLADYGDFYEIYGTDIVVDAIGNILSTIKGTYLFDPDYGTELPKFVFDQLDDVTQEAIEGEVKTVLENWVPNISVDSVKSYKAPDKSIIVDIFLTYLGMKTEIKALVTKEFVSILKEG